MNKVKYDKNNKLRLLINYFGSVPKIAKTLKISRSAIYQWKKIPEKRAYQIEKITKGKIKSSRLFP